MVFHEDGETSEDERCPIKDEFIDLLRSWEPYIENEGLDIHYQMHMLEAILFFLRQSFTPLDLVLVVNNAIKTLEYNLAVSGYMVVTEDGPGRFPGPELRMQVEDEVANTDIPDMIPDWLAELTREEGDEEE